MKTGKNAQQGVGFAGLILIVAGLLFIAILGMKLVPAYLHNAEIERLFKVVASDPEMQAAAVKDVRASYAKRAMMDSISEVSAEDVEVSKEAGRLALSASYTVKIPVAGNIILVLEFSPSSAK